MKIIWDDNESAAPVAPLLLETEAEIERFFAEMKAEIAAEEDDEEE
jgi:hypothetical protein